MGAGKKKRAPVLGQQRVTSPLSHGKSTTCSPVLIKINLQLQFSVVARHLHNIEIFGSNRGIMPGYFDKPCRDLSQWIFSNIPTVPLHSYLYFHPKEFRRIECGSTPVYLIINFKLPLRLLFEKKNLRCDHYSSLGSELVAAI